MKKIAVWNRKKSVSFMNKHAGRVANLEKAREVKGILRVKRRRRMKVQWFIKQAQMGFGLFCIGFFIVMVVFGSDHKQEVRELLNPVISEAAAQPTASPTPAPTEDPELLPAGNSKGGVDINFRNSQEAYILTSRSADIIYRQWQLESNKGTKGWAVKCRTNATFNDFGFGVFPRETKQSDGTIIKKLSGPCFTSFEESVDKMVKWWDDNWDENLERTLCKYNTGKAQDWCPYVDAFNALPDPPVKSAR